MTEFLCICDWKGKPLVGDRWCWLLWENENGMLDTYCEVAEGILFSFNHQLDWHSHKLSERIASAEEWVDQSGLRACMWGIILMVNWCKGAQPKVDGTILSDGGPQLYKPGIRAQASQWARTTLGSGYTYLVRQWVPRQEVMLCGTARGPAFKFLPEVLPWLPSIMDCYLRCKLKEISPYKLLLVRVFKHGKKRSWNDVLVHFLLYQ